MPRDPSAVPRPAGASPGFSLTELLVACGIALIVMAALASLFGIFSRGLSQTQATAALTTQMRTVAWQLRQDLAGLTVGEVAPVGEPAADAGYFELIEGPLRDTTNAFTAAGTPTANLAADTDDILMFTTWAAAQPFTSRLEGGRQESRCAEVAWFVRRRSGSPSYGVTQMYDLYRRQLVVVNVVASPFGFPGSSHNRELVSSPPSNRSEMWALLRSGRRDISLRQEKHPTDVNQVCLLPNTLGDLCKRENRFNRSPLDPADPTFLFPFKGVDQAWLTDPPNRVVEGQDIVLSNVIAFDVRVFDPEARALPVAGLPSLYPGDRTYNGTAAMAGTGSRGAYIDLGSASDALPLPPGPATILGGAMNASSRVRQPETGFGAPASGNPRPVPAPFVAWPTYDTWSLHYAGDQGTNGVDDDNDDLADNPAEFEVPPPYAVPLRGIEVRIRCYEPTSKQVRQITVRHTFLRR